LDGTKGGSIEKDDDEEEKILKFFMAIVVGSQGASWNIE